MATTSSLSGFRWRLGGDPENEVIISPKSRPLNIVRRSYFRANANLAVRVTLEDQTNMKVECLTKLGHYVYYTHYFLLVGERWPFSVVEDSIKDEEGNSVTDPQRYSYSADEFTPDDTIVIRFDSYGKPIGWSS